MCFGELKNDEYEFSLDDVQLLEKLEEAKNEFSAEETWNEVKRILRKVNEVWICFASILEEYMLSHYVGLDGEKICINYS